MPSIDTILRIILIGISVYLLLIFMLRISGKRTLSKWNSFDFVVTIAFGSTLASTLLNKQITLPESITAFALLIALQYAITFLSFRSKFIEKLIKSSPSLLFHRGKYIDKHLKQQRVSKTEILAAARNHGYASLEQIEAIILETDGSFSVIPTTDPQTPATALSDVDKDTD